MTKRLRSFSKKAEAYHYYFKAMEPFVGLASGVPTDQTLKSVLWQSECYQGQAVGDVEETSAGMLYTLPMMPFSGEEAEHLLGFVVPLFEQYHFEPYITLNAVDARVLEGVISVSFDKSNGEQQKRALSLIDAIEERCLERGYVLYRRGIQHRKGANCPEAYMKVIEGLKNFLDPNHILSPGHCEI